MSSTKVVSPRKREVLDPPPNIAEMNELTDRFLISDLAVTWDDVSDEDKERGIPVILELRGD